MSMFNPPFAHRLMRKLVIGFGSLFSDVQILRFASDGTVAQTIQVPIAYGPKEKILRPVEANPNQTQNVYLPLPRMAFQIDGYTFDSSRKVNKSNKITANCPDGTHVVFAPVPYNVDLSLWLIAKGQEDSLAVVEQVLPLFSPEYNLQINMVDELGLLMSVPIVFNSATISDDYEGSFDQSRLVTHTFAFTAKMNFFGPVLGGNGKMILNTIVTLPMENLKYTAVGTPPSTIDIDEWTNV